MTKFDPRPILNALPSIYKNFYGDRDVLLAVYEGLLRIQDADYVELFTADDNKALSSAQVFTSYPVVYEEFNNWKYAEVPHAHAKVTVDFDPTTSNYLGGSTQYYRIRFPNQIFRDEIILYLDGRVVPPFLYTKSVEPYYASGNKVHGTTVYINAANIHNYLGGLPITGTEWQSGVATGQEQVWPPIAEIEKASAYSFRAVEVLTADGDGETKEFSMSVGADVSIDPLASVVYIESVDVTSQVAITTISTGVYRITAKTPFRFPDRQKVKVVFADDSIIYVEARDNSAVVVSSSTIDSVHLPVNFKLGDTYEISSTGITLTQGNQFLPGGKLRVVDRLGAQSINITQATNRASFNRKVDAASAKITYFGVDITGVNLSATSLSFASAVPNNTQLVIYAALVNEHSHVELSKTLTTDTNTVSLVASYMTGAALGNENTNFPTRVFVDELLAIPGQDYSLSGATTINFVETLPEGTKITVRYDSDEDAFSHRHEHKTFFTSEPTENNRVFVLDVDADPDNIEITLDASTLHEKDLFSLSFNRTIRFNDPIASGIPVTVHSLSRPWNYSHIIPDRADSEYGYRGRIKRIGSIQDGLTQAEVILTSDKFELVEENDEVVLYTNTPIEEAWLFNVSVDESALSKIWGELVDFKRASSQKYLDTLSALIAALRAPATTDNLINFGSILLGSKYLPESGISLGVAAQDSENYVRIDPLNPDSFETLIQLLPDAPIRIKEKQVMPRLYAVNALLKVFEKESLQDVPWLSFFAKELSDTYKYAKRLDAGFFNKFTSTPNFYLPESRIITDYSVDFVTEEVQPGTIFKLTINTIKVVDGLATFSPISIVTRATRVINRNQVEIDFVYPEDEGAFDPEGVGFGQLGFGQGSYGGIQYVPAITQYTAWTRRTRKVDIGYFLDHALNSDQAIVSGEDSVELTAQLAAVLKHNAFAVEINSSYITDETSLLGLQKLIVENRPAETKAFIYSVVDNPEEEFDVSFTEDSLQFSPANLNDGDEFAAGQSYFGSQFVARNDGTTLLYDTDQLNPGPVVFAVTPAPISPEVANRYLIIADREALIDFDSSFATLYSSEHGLEGKIVRTIADDDGIIYKVSAPQGLRNNRYALHLNQDRTLETDQIDYSSGPLTFRTLLNIDANTHSPSESPIVFQFANGYFKMGVRVENDDTFTPFFSANGGATYAISNTSFSPNSPVHLVGTYRQIGNYWRTSIFVNGVFRGISSLPASPALTIVPSFTSSAIFAAASPSPSSYHHSISAKYDESILSEIALTSPQIVALYNAGDVRWSSPMGYGSDGSPLAETGSILVYHYDTDMGTDRILDYSGLGYNATRYSLAEDDNGVWHMAGYVKTPLSSSNDIHDIDPTGFYVNPNRISSTLDSGDGEGGPKPYVSITSLFRDTRVDLNPINVSFIFNSVTESWSKTTTRQLLPGAFSETLEVNAPFTGFTSGQNVGPDGETYGQSSPVTLTYRGTSVSFGENNSGSITSIQVNGTEYLSILNKGMNFQEKWDTGNLFRLCEAGAEAQSPDASSYSRFISDESNSLTHKSKTYVAYSSPYVFDGDTLECSSNIFSRRTRLGYLNNPRILEISSLFSLYESARINSFSWLMSLSLTSDFTTVYYFNVGTRGVSSNTPDLRQILSPGEFELVETTAKGGVIVTTADGAKAFGIYQHGATNPEYHLQTYVKSEITPSPHTLFIFREHNTPGTGVAPSGRSRKRFACVGSFGDVVGAFQQIYQDEESIPPGSIGSSATTIDTTFTALPNPLYPSSPFSLQLTALTSGGFIDSAYQAPVALTLLSGSGSLSGTTSTSFTDGEATLTNLSFTTVGYKTLLVASGSLTPSIFDMVVEAKAPTLASITPTTVVEDIATSVSLFGSNFETNSKVEVSLSGVTLAEVSPTFVSPGELTVNLSDTLIADPGQYALRVLTPEPGGGYTGLEYLTVSPAPGISATNLVVSGRPDWVLRNTSSVFSIVARDAVANQTDPAASGTVTLAAVSPVSGYDVLPSIPSSSAAFVNGSATLTVGAIDGKGLYRFKFTHSGSYSPIWSDPIALYNPDPGLFSVSPNIVSPGSGLTLTLRGTGFADSDTVATFNGLNRVTNLLSPTMALLELLPVDLAVPGSYPITIGNNFTISQAATYNNIDQYGFSNRVSIQVNPPYVPPPVFSPHKLEITGASGDIWYVNAKQDRVVRVVSSPENINASFATGLIKMKMSPVGHAGATYSSSQSPTGSFAAFSPVVTTPGSYLLTVTHSPQVGSVTYRPTEESVVVNTYGTSLSSLAPAKFSPSSASFVCNLYGSNFDASDALIFIRRAGSSVFSPKTVTFVSPSHISFNFVSSDFNSVVAPTNVYVRAFNANGFANVINELPVQLVPAAPPAAPVYTMDFEGGGAYPLTYVLYPSPTNRSVSFQASGINDTGIKRIYIRDQFNQVATAATGSVRLRLSPSPMPGVNDGTIYTTGWVPVVGGYATFSPSNTFFTVKNPGRYQWVARHSPTSGVTAAEARSANRVTIARVLPTITLISPISITQGTLVPSIHVTASNVFGNSFGSLFPGKTTALVNGQPRNFTVLSPKGGLLSPTPVDLTAGSRLITVKQPFAAVPSSFGSDYTSNAASFNVVGNTLSEEGLPATVVVSPLGAKRVRRLINNVVTVVNEQVTAGTVGTNGSTALRLALRNIAGKVISSGTTTVPSGPHIPIDNTIVPGYGATEVIEISAGYYEPGSLDISASATPNLYGRPGQPVIIRAKKVNGIAQPVVVAAENDSFYVAAGFISQSSTPYDPSYMHFYDLIVRAGSRAGCFYDYAYNLDNPANSAQNGMDLLYKDHQHHRVHIAGHYDRRIVQLTPKRNIVSTVGNTQGYLTGNPQWDDYGNLIQVPAITEDNKPFYSLDFKAITAHRAIWGSADRKQMFSYATSVACDRPISIPAIVLDSSYKLNYTYDSLTNPEWCLRLTLQTYASSTSSIAHNTALSQFEGGAESPLPNKLYSNIEYQNSAGGWVPVGISQIARLSAHSPSTFPLSGKIVGGVAQYPNLRFKKPGLYAFNCELYNNITGQVIPFTSAASGAAFVKRRILINVSSPGISQKETTLVKPYYDALNTSGFSGADIDLPSINYYNDPALGHGRTSRLTLPVIARMNFDTTVTTFGYPGIAPMVDGSLSYRIAPASYTAGWRWGDATGHVHPVPNVASPDTLVGVMRNGFGALYTTRVNGAVDAQNSTNGAFAPTLIYQGAGTPPNPIVQVTKRSTKAPEVTLSGTVTYTVPLATVTTAAAVDTPTKLSTPPTSQMTFANQLVNYGFANYRSAGVGRVWMNGWPSPAHPNYPGPRFMHLYPHPSTCPGIVYNSSVYKDGKWGYQIYGLDFFGCYGGTVRSIGEEHGFYTHECKTLVFENMLISDNGRTNIQVHYRRYGMPPEYIGSTANGTRVPRPFNADNTAPYGHSVTIKNCVLEDAGLKDGPVAISVAEYGSDVFIKDNVISAGYDLNLRHSIYWGTTGVICYGGGQTKTHQGVYLVTDVVSGQQYGVSNFDGFVMFDPFLLTNNGQEVLDQLDVTEYLQFIYKVGTYGVFRNTPNVPANSTADGNYLWKLLAPYPHLRLSDGTVTVGLKKDDNNTPAATSFKFNNPRHAHRNRAYGHPIFSTPGYSRQLTLLKPNFGYANETNQLVTMGSPTTGFHYGGRQQIGNVVIDNNEIKMNRWNASWGTGAFPQGAVTAYKYAGGNFTQGTGTKAALQLSSIRHLLLTNNKILGGGGNTPFVISQVGSAFDASAPILVLEGYNNQFNFVSLNYMGRQPTSTSSSSYVPEDHPYVNALDAMFKNPTPTVPPSPNV